MWSRKKTLSEHDRWIAEIRLNNAVLRGDLNYDVPLPIRPWQPWRRPIFWIPLWPYALGGPLALTGWLLGP